MFKNLKAHVTFTTDMWTSNQHLGYMAITAPCINDDFVLEKTNLAFKRVSYPHMTTRASQLMMFFQIILLNGI